jgi:hypothetical protein
MAQGSAANAGMRDSASVLSIAALLQTLIDFGSVQEEVR